MRNTIVLLAASLIPSAAFGQHLPGTEPLKEKADFARVMLEGLDRWLDRENQTVAKNRDKNLKLDTSSPAAYDESLEPQRVRLRKALGVIDARLPPTGFEFVATSDRPALLATTDQFKAYAVRWPVLPGVFGEGLLLEPTEAAKANVVALPDADQTPEQIAGLSAGLEPRDQYARRLAELGFRVVVPVLIDRKDTWSVNPTIGRLTNQSHREFIWRMSYEMGRHMIGYEVQRVLAAVDEFAKGKLPIGVVGFGEGGRIALYAAAIDRRIGTTMVMGAFGPREKIHDEPIDRDVWSLLREFGDAEVARLIGPRKLQVAHAVIKPVAPNPAEKGRGGAAPGTLKTIAAPEVRREVERLLDKDNKVAGGITFIDLAANADANDVGLADNMVHFYAATLNSPVMIRNRPIGPALPAITYDPTPRQKRQFDELVAFTQKLMPEAVRRRQENVWNKLDTKSIDGFKKSQEPLREKFLNEIVGNMPEPIKDFKPRTRLILETPKWKGYEVVLDVFDEVIAYGILLVPSDIKPGEKRPCVVCQHGLEGRPMDVVDPTKKTPYYNSFGAQLADRGFVVFAPQAPYIFRNDFRQVVRKMHPLGYNLYAVIVRQHQQILNFLGTLDFVDASRIAYYGLSYGGKVAMRIPSIVTGYCAVICSGDFNEWIWKNINLEWLGSYMFTGEYDMYEFNLGNTFNYAEMSALIAPRPFMVERGHDDGVGLDEYVAFEYAKTRRLFSRLGIPERTEIEFFAGGHEIRGVGTFAFLRKHLNWPN